MSKKIDIIEKTDNMDKTDSNTNVEKTDKKIENVSLPKKTLEAILSRLEGLEESNKQLSEKDKKKDEEIEMLKSISDKARLARFEEKNKGSALIRTAKVSFWEGSPILAWSKIKDEVGFRDGRLVVNQQVKLFLDAIDPETKQLKTVDLDYLYWAQNVECLPGDVIEKSSSNSGDFWTIQMKDGRKVKLDIRFINAF